MAEKNQEFDESDGGYEAPLGGYTPGGRSEPGPGDDDPHKPVHTPPKPPAGHGKGGK